MPQTDQIDHLLAVAAGYRQAGELGRADALYQSILARNPAHGDAWHMRGVLAYQAGDAVTAVECLKRAVAFEPRRAAYWSNLGLFYLAARRTDDAIVAMRRAIALEPGLALAHSNLGNALNEKGLFEAAEAACREALRLQPDLAAAQNNLGVALTGEQRQSEAVDCYRRAIELDSKFVDAHRNLAHALRDQGNFEEARREYETVLALNPRETASLYGLSMITRHHPGDSADLARVEQRLLDPLLSASERAELNFAAGKICDDCGWYDRAFEHFHRGNQAVRPAWDRRSCEQTVDALIEAFSAERVQRATASGHPSEKPVFVVGMPRSGTTLVEQILATNRQVAACGEVPDIQQAMLDLEAGATADNPWPGCLLDIHDRTLVTLAEKYLARRLVRHPDAVRITDKMPTNFFHLGLIWRMFPNARVIHCARDPRDACLSCYCINFSTPLEFAYDLEDLGVFYRLYERVMSHWRSVLPLSILNVQYERLVADPATEARRIVEFCDLPWDDRYLRFYENRNAVRTSSGWQVRQPIYSGAVGRWRHYERHLGPLFQALATVRQS